MISSDFWQTVKSEEDVRRQQSSEVKQDEGSIYVVRHK